MSGESSMGQLHILRRASSPSRDFLTRTERSALMSRIGGKNTGIERTVFTLLRRSGLRFRRHVRALPGCPDAVLHDFKLVVFVDGDFWHGRGYRRTKTKLK